MSTLSGTDNTNLDDKNQKSLFLKLFTMRNCILLAIPMIIGTLCINVMYFTPQTTFAQVIEAFTEYNPDDLVHYVVRQVKVPRILGGFIVGGLLAVAGAVMQGITRNYLASPDVVGISDGANLGLAISLALSAGTSSYINNIIFSMIGAACSTCIIFYLSSKIKGREGGVKLLLAGSALGMLFSSAASSINIWSGLGLTVQIWNNSGLLGLRWEGIYVMLIGFVGLAMAFMNAGRITVLGMGDDTAISLGQNVKFTKLIGVLTVVFISSATVCTVGNIGFVGLIIPNMVKMSVGEDYKKVIPYSAFFGSMLIATADVVSRLFNYPFETPIGTVTSIIGIPIFLYLINGKKNRGALQ